METSDELFAEFEEAAAERDAAEAALPVSQDVARIAGELEFAKEYLDRSKAVTAKAQAEYDRLRKDVLPKAMESVGLKNFTTDSGYRISLRTDHYAGIRADDAERLLAWLRDTGNDSLIKETVHHKTLSSFARELIAERGPAAIPDFVNVHSERTAVLTKVSVANTQPQES